MAQISAQDFRSALKAYSQANVPKGPAPDPNADIERQLLEAQLQGRQIENQAAQMQLSNPQMGVTGMSAKDLGISAGVQDELATMATVEQQIDSLTNRFGSTGNIPGVGYGTGSVTKILNQLGVGKKENREAGTTARAVVGQIQGTIAKLRGGTSFTPNEQALLESYTPTINDSDETIRTKLQSLKTFIQQKREAGLTAALNPMALLQGGQQQPQQNNDPLGLGL